MYSDRPNEVTEAGFTVDELRRRLSKIEINRDEGLLQIDSLQATLRRSKTKYFICYKLNQSRYYILVGRTRGI